MTFKLTNENFKTLVETKTDLKNWMLLFHSPNCPHCVDFKPTFYKSAFEHKEKNVIFGEINCKE